jgi:Na+/citrate or Na+/malate symporter
MMTHGIIGFVFAIVMFAIAGYILKSGKKIPWPLLIFVIIATLIIPVARVNPAKARKKVRAK